MSKTRNLLVMLAGFVAVVVLLLLNAGSARAVTPTVVPGNPSCTDLGYSFGFKPQPEPPPSGTYPFPGGSVTISSNGTFFDWTSTLSMDAVIVKGGNNANVYVYNPESFGDTGLHPPDNASGGPAAISHIEFCFDFELTVSKTATTTFNRTWHWDIDKSVTPATWDMFQGDSGTSAYTVMITRTGSTDSDWAVSGSITIFNNTPYTATVTSVSDSISGGIGAVSTSCTTFPTILVPGATLNCTYNTGLPDAASRTNTATVSTSGTVGGGSATAPVTFGAPIEINGTINVSDTVEGALGTASANKTFSYSRTFSCNDDEGTHPNTATIVETDQSDSASVTVNCYELSVRKNATTSFRRSWTWTIDKSADQSSLLLSVGQPHVVNYTIVVAPTPHDGSYAVSGDIWVANPAPIAANLLSVNDVISPSIAATVNCGVTFPYSLAGGGTLHCTYSASLPNADSRLNTATATLQNYSYAANGTATASGTHDFSGSAAVNFSSDPSEELDECITLSDTFSGGPQGVVICAGDPPASFTRTYPRTVSFSVCGPATVDNTASFVTNDTPATGEDNVSIPVSVPCQGGCTLTQGYWKTHSDRGPAPYDDAWKNIGPLEEDTIFYLSGKTYYQVLWTAPQGNVYYILAQQYIAAQLNILNGASTTAAVDAAMTGAQAFFSTKTPTSTLSKAYRTQLLGYAATLDSYNNGLIGPGHCSE